MAVRGWGFTLSPALSLRERGFKGHFAAPASAYQGRRGSYTLVLKSELSDTSPR